MKRAFEMEENGHETAASHLESVIDLEMQRINRYDSFISSQQVNDF